MAAGKTVSDLMCPVGVLPAIAADAPLREAVAALVLVWPLLGMPILQR